MAETKSATDFEVEEYSGLFTKFARACLDDHNFKKAYKKNVVTPLAQEILIHVFVVLFSILLVIVFIFLGIASIATILVIKLL